jgi:glycolate oxidase iron-sulfur subunit
MHLVDHGRAYIEATYRRPWHDRLTRWLLAKVLPYPRRFRLALAAARLGKPFKGAVGALPLVGSRLRAMLELAPARLPARGPTEDPGVFKADGVRRGRVALLCGCAQPILQPAFNRAAIRLLNRHGIEVVLPRGEGCCGALVHHMGRDDESHAFARRNIDAWMAEIDGEGLDAIVITASGCGTTIKDYGFMLRDDAAYADKARRVAQMTLDVTEYLTSLKMIDPVRETGHVVAYHSACSMQHGQQIREEPKKLLKQAGFAVKDVPEGHICCGSAGTYNILQPELANALRARKVANIERVAPEIIATGNIGCITQIARGTMIPIVHTVELLDWATGGPLPEALGAAGVDRVARPPRVAAE